MSISNKLEAAIAREIIRQALDLGYLISVNDGEEWTVARSKNGREIYAALASTSDDMLLFRKMNAEGKAEKIGMMHLVWGNDCDLISDYTDNEAMRNLVAFHERSMATIEALENEKRAKIHPEIKTSYSGKAEIIASVATPNGERFVTCRLHPGPMNFVNWRLSQDGSTYLGHYFKTEGEAVADMFKRANP